jgi:hypothetical protein
LGVAVSGTTERGADGDGAQMVGVVSGRAVDAVQGAVAPALAVAGRAGRALQDALQAGR